MSLSAAARAARQGPLVEVVPAGDGEREHGVDLRGEVGEARPAATVAVVAEQPARRAVGSEQLVERGAQRGPRVLVAARDLVRQSRDGPADLHALARAEPAGGGQRALQPAEQVGGLAAARPGVEPEEQAEVAGGQLWAVQL